MNNIKLRMTRRQHSLIKGHLFPGDGKEAVAVVLCGRSNALGTEILVAHSVHLVPHCICQRSPTSVTWPPTHLQEMLVLAASKNLAVVKFHSHPTAYRRFSRLDDESDRRLFESVYGWMDNDRPHASAIMLPDGEVLARAVLVDGTCVPIDSVQVVGDDIRIWSESTEHEKVSSFSERHAQLLGQGTTQLLGTLRVAVIGCSGTGSIVIEQLTRLGIGELVLVDPDIVEDKNVNRILGTTVEDARKGLRKVDALSRHIGNIGLGTRVHAFPLSLENADAIRAIAACDVVVGCMDTLSGRHHLARLARFYVLPYIDVGVKLEALQDGSINQIAGSVHYLQPEGLDFLDREVFTIEALEAEDLLLSNPEEYRRRLDAGYIKGVRVERPAVISVNMCYASLAVNELLARLHPLRIDGNGAFGTTRLSFSHGHFEHEPDHPAPDSVLQMIGRGDMEPLLNMPRLSTIEYSVT